MRTLPLCLVAAALTTSLAACGGWELQPAAEDAAPLDDARDGGDALDEDALDEDARDEDDGLEDDALDDEVEGEVADDAVLEEIVVGSASHEQDALEVALDGDAAEEAIADDDVEAAARAAPRIIERTLRTLHWNIAGGKENDCRTAGITRAVLRYVRQHDIDFVGLNEVCPSQYRAIRAALREHWGKRRDVVFSAYVDDGDTGRVVGNAIFSKRRLDVVSRLKLGQDRYGDRWLLCGRTAVRKHLRFCSAHLTPGDATARRQMAKVHERVEAWWRDRNDTVILSGDLNINPDDRALNAVYAAEASTRNNPNNHGRYRELDDDDRNHCRGYGEKSHAGNGGPCREGGKIDFIFARENRIVAGDYGADSLAVPNDCTGRCSDHRAIVGRARLKIRVD